MSKTVCVVTGTRAEYGLLKSPMRHIRSSEALELALVVTGMHLSPQYGETVKEIESDGFHVDRKVEMLIDGDSGLSMAKSTGLGLMGMADAFREIDPDIILVLGDRDEPLAAAIAAAHMNIPVAHVHGGDATSGATIDDSIRYALTKFSHVHFPASADSADRIERLGEEAWRLQIVGAPGLDPIRSEEYVSGDEMRSRFDIPPGRDLVLCVQHPLTTRPEVAGDQMSATIDALSGVDASVIIIYPNSDAGSNDMIDVIENHPGTDEFHVRRNVPREEYLGLMETADVMVGNSSSGIIESASFDLPVVDVGPRQKGRQRPANVTSVPHDEMKIRRGVAEALAEDGIRERARESENPYDYGGSGEQIAAFLEELTIDDSLLQKEITY